MNSFIHFLAQFYKHLSGRSVLDNFLVQEDGPECTMVIKIDLIPFSDCKIFPFIKGFIVKGYGAHHALYNEGLWGTPLQ